MGALSCWKKKCKTQSAKMFVRRLCLIMLLSLLGVGEITEPFYLEGGAHILLGICNVCTCNKS